ncbi:MAG TPA: hypothetical protein VGW75_07090 [Solirubrobacteraceae bacterium]|jgi:hypothetical protein|nr:hypothetical protein [Solirubrobacteraceae bacterium]
MEARIVRAGTYAALAVSMAAVCGAAGYAAGRGTADFDAAFERGWTAGELSARTAANDRYGVGGPGREAIRRRAIARGRAAGYRAGRRAGFAAGRREGIRIGEQSAFAGFDGGWRVGAWYAVRIGHGEGVRGYSIPTRVALSGRRSYRLCGAGVCTSKRRQ